MNTISKIVDCYVAATLIGAGILIGKTFVDAGLNMFKDATK